MVLIVAAVVLFVLVTSLRGIAGFYTEFLWFDSLGQERVFRDILAAKFALFAMFTAAFFALLWVNLYLADRFAPRFAPVGSEDEVVVRYRALVGTRTGIVRIGAALLFALIAGAPTTSQWQEWILFNNSVDFGETDPLFDRDVGFYVFELPFLSFVVGWLFAALVIVLLVTAVAHYLNGGIRPQAAAPQRVSAGVKVHLSVLLGLLAIVKAAGYWLQRFELTTSTRGTVDGATYTDVNAQLPAINLLALIALAAAVLFLLNTRRKGWVLPALGIGIWAVVAVVGGAIVPAAVQRFRVDPAESSTEREYIVDNIEATLAAMDLNDVRAERFIGDAPLSEEELADHADVVSNIRLWDTGALTRTYHELQALRPYYRITDVDVDRYEIDGRVTQVMVSARELHSDEAPQQSWEARHLAFTHGYGLVVSPANAKEASGRPSLAVSDVPVNDEVGIGVEQPGIYIGEGLDGYVMVRTDREEIDFQDENDQTIFTEYDGEDGVGVGSFFRRAAFALRFGDLNPMFSGNLRDDSRILYYRDVDERVRAIAPFLEFDQDPYPVAVDGRIKWIVDAYTTTNRYPYGQRAVLDGLEGSDLDHRFNYIRNPVKAVVDAYDGSVELYIVDDTDPIVRAWQRAFPGLFSDDEPSEELRAHFRYPEDLFRVQTNMWARYHIGADNPDDFFNNVGAWTVAPDPGSPVEATASDTTTTTNPDAPPTQTGLIEPYYLLTRLPGDEEESFVLLRPFVPVQGERPVLTGFLVADSDPDNYGELVSYETPPTRSVDGPRVVANTIGLDPRVSEDQTVLCQRGSNCEFGNLVFVPMGQSLLYVQPLYIVSETNDFPLLRRVIVEFNGQVGYADTLREAMLQIFDEVPQTLEDDAPDPGDEDPPDGDDEPALPEDVAALLDRADQLFEEGEAALNEGGSEGIATYAEKVAEARELIQQAQAILAGEAEGDSPPTSTTTTTTGEPA